MEEMARKISETAGLAPGTVVPVGIDASAPSKFIVSVIEEGNVQVERLGTMPENLPTYPEQTTLWIDVQGLAGLTSIKRIFKALDIHPLIQEDILNTRQHPKVEVLQNSLLITAKRLYLANNSHLYGEQVAFLRKGNCLVTFQPAGRDSFVGVRKRQLLFKGAHTAPDYVMYALLDNFVDNYFEIIEQLETNVERVEKKLIADEEDVGRGVLITVKQNVTYARHVLWSLKNILMKLDDVKEHFFAPELFPYLRDVRDHVWQLEEACEMTIDMANSVIQLNMDNINNRTNEIMKTLALISTVFLPLTFIAGVYGMNFKFMPELDSRWGYPFVLGIMALIAIILYRSFKNKHWL